MLTWINEKAKWIIVIFAAGIVVGLLAMDRVPNQTQTHPVAVIDGKTKVSYAEFDAELKRATDAQKRNAEQMEDADYNNLRNNVFRRIVSRVLIEKQFEKAGLGASVAEIKDFLKRNPDWVRGQMANEVNSALYVMQRQGATQEDMNRYISALPQFLLDSVFNKESYDAWLETPDAFQWSSMRELENELKNKMVPQLQLQALVNGSVHTTSVEAAWEADRRSTDYQIQVATVGGFDFPVEDSAIDTAAVKAYFNANPDSFVVEKNSVVLQYAMVPVAPTAKDEQDVKEYAENIYNQLIDTTSTASFEDMAKFNSEDPGSRDNGGMLGDDYIPRGRFVKEFEDAAYALDSGAISAPIRSSFGYHIIKSFGKKTDSTGVESIKCAHILLTVNATSATIDSLEKVMVEVKNAVEVGGKTLAEAAAEQKVGFATSDWLTQGESVRELGYMKGLSSFAFPNKDLPEPYTTVSPVMKNNQFVAVAIKADSVKAGERNFAKSFESIKSSLRNAKASEEAAKYLTSVSDKVKAWNVVAGDSVAAEAPTVEKVSFQTITTTADGYVAGFGASSNELAKVLQQKEGEWGSVVTTGYGAAMVRVVSKNAKSAEDLKTIAAANVSSIDQRAKQSIFEEFIMGIEAATPVVNNLDLFYRD